MFTVKHPLPDRERNMEQQSNGLTFSRIRPEEYEEVTDLINAAYRSRSVHSSVGLLYSQRYVIPVLRLVRRASLSKTHPELEVVILEVRAWLICLRGYWW